MKNGKCFFCYDSLAETENDVHLRCNQKFFKHKDPLIVDLTLEGIEELANQTINQRLSVTGVQRKMSVDLVRDKSSPSRRLTMGVGDHYLVKTPTERFPEMVELEDLTMHMASVAGIEVAKHCLIRLSSGELAYLVKRFDRGKKTTKFSQEDFCQLSELPTAEKYSSSHEKAGKIIKRWSSNPGLDAIRFLESVIFSFVSGNSDMHLKNFSLLTLEDGSIQLSPAYDLLSTQLLTDDEEETALTLNAKKSNLKRDDFLELGKNLQIPPKVALKTLSRFQDHHGDFNRWIKKSFVSPPMQKKFLVLVKDRLKRLEEDGFS